MRDHSPNLPQELLQSGVTVRLRVTGRSMSPYLVDDDLVTLEPVAPSGIRLGDLVYTRQQGRQPLLHRVIGRSRGAAGAWTIHTKGDALMAGDPAVDAGLVAGKVVSIVRLLTTGASREVRLESRRQRLMQRCLALVSRHAPRSFAAISRRLVPGMERLLGRERRNPGPGGRG